MFDIGWSELVLIGVVALIVIGPKELPSVLRMVGRWTGKVRRMAAEFQGQFSEALREAEMADLKKQVDDISETARSLTRFDPLADRPSKPAPEPSKPVESGLVDAAAQPALPAVNDAAGALPAVNGSPPPAAGGTEFASQPAPPEPASSGDPKAASSSGETQAASSPIAPANAGAPSTNPRPVP